jgi:phosphatidylglycerol---prolipoprotein diacylglyceryl transferase
MCQTLFFIPREIAGYPMFGPGLLLAVWALASFCLIVWLAWRQGWNADTWGYVSILLLIGAIIRWVLPALSEQQGLPIRGFGMMNMLGVIAGASLAAWRAKRRGLDPDLIFSLVFWMLVPGIIGARAFYVTEYWPEYYRIYASPDGGLGALLVSIVDVPGGGLVIYGAFMGGMLGLVLFVRKHRLPLLAICDLMAPSMALGLAIGRIGCLMNGCCFGAVCDHSWAITFPSGAFAYRAQVERGQMYGFSLGKLAEAEPTVRSVVPDSSAAKTGLKPGDLLRTVNGLEISANGDAYAALEDAFNRQQPLHIETAGGSSITIPVVAPPPRSLPVHPTQIYSVIDGFLLCLVLLVWSRFHRRDGAVMALMMSIYPISRFYVETLRSDEAPVLGTGMSISQNVSLLILACAVGLWAYVYRRQTLNAKR